MVGPKIGVATFGHFWPLFARSIFDLDFGSIFDLILEPKWSQNELLFGHFWHQKSMKKSTPFPDVQKVAPGTKNDDIWAPPTRKIIKKRQVLYGYFENQLFPSECPLGSKKSPK